MSNQLEKLFEQYKMNPSDARSKSTSWFNRQIALMNTMKLNAKMVIRQRSDATEQSSKFLPGSMYLFEYDALHAATLPYWDRYPLIIPFVPSIGVKHTPGAFHGLNLHYLHPQLRVQLLDKLMVFATNKSMDDNTKLKFTWQIASAAAKNKHLGACIKMYLIKQVKSMPVKILPEYWVSAMMLPVEGFQGSNKTAVWQQSRSM